MEKPTIKGTAIFSPCRKYRYVLTRELNAGTGTLVFIMLNPSTADEKKNDPTVAKCMHYASVRGYANLVVLNVYALRSTDPSRLTEVEDPVGPENLHHIYHYLKRDDCSFVVAWGNLADAGIVWRIECAAALYKRRLRCLKVNKGGQPKHPLYHRKHTKFIDWPGMPSH